MLLIVPTSHHRVLFRCGDKDHLVRIANRYAIAGLACLGVAMVGALVFVSDVVFGTLLAGAVGALAAVACAWLWYGQPLLRRHALVRASAAAVARATSGRVGGRRLESSGSTVTRDPVSNRDALPCTACREGEPGYAAWSRPQ